MNWGNRQRSFAQYCPQSIRHPPSLGGSLACHVLSSDNDSKSLTTPTTLLLQPSFDLISRALLGDLLFLQLVCVFDYCAGNNLEKWRA